MSSEGEASPPRIEKTEFEPPDSTAQLRQDDFHEDDEIHHAAMQEWGTKILGGVTSGVNTLTKLNIPGLTKKKARELDDDEDVDVDADDDDDYQDNTFFF